MIFYYFWGKQQFLIQLGQQLTKANPRYKRVFIDIDNRMIIRSFLTSVVDVISVESSRLLFSFPKRSMLKSGDNWSHSSTVSDNWRKKLLELSTPQHDWISLTLDIFRKICSNSFDDNSDLIESNIIVRTTTKKMNVTCIFPDRWPFYEITKTIVSVSQLWRLQNISPQMLVNF